MPPSTDNLQRHANIERGKLPNSSLSQPVLYRPHRTPDPYGKRADLHNVIVLRRADQRSLGPIVDDLVVELTTLADDGREVSTISARAAIRWVLLRVARGWRDIGHQEICDRFGLSLSTVGRMLGQLRDAGILWRPHTGRKGESVSQWSLAPRAVAYLAKRVQWVRDRKAAKRSQYVKNTDRVWLPPEGRPSNPLPSARSAPVDNSADRRRALAVALGQSGDECEHEVLPSRCQKCRSQRC